MGQSDDGISLTSNNNRDTVTDGEVVASSEVELEIDTETLAAS